MKILGMDTSGPFASVALLEDGILLHEIAANHGLKHSETLMVLIDQMMKACDFPLSEVDLFCCVAGPGSFTGVRIGVCCVKGMAHALSKPALSLNALEVLALDAGPARGIICPMLDARRDQVYASAFRMEGALPVRAMEDAALSLSQYLDALPGGEMYYFTGDGARAHRAQIANRFGDRAAFAPGHRMDPRAGAACALALLKRDEAVQVMNIKPIYLRAPQAERERAQREAARDA